MVLRLSELLERIRPSGAPGASSEGEQQHHLEDLNRETIDVAPVLAGFEAEVEAVLAAAHEEAERVRQNGEQQARHIQLGLSDRIAVARSAAARQHDQVGLEELARITRDSTAEVARLQATAIAQAPRLVDAAMETIWSSLTPDPPSQDSPPQDYP